MLTLDETVQINYKYIAYLITLKIAKPDLFSRFTANSVDPIAHKESKAIIDNIIKRGKGYGMVNDVIEESLTNFSEWHGMYIGDSRSSTESLPDFSVLVTLIDLPVG